MDPVSKEEIGRIYLGADVAIVPLMDLQVFKTVFPSKTFELMAFGVPIILGVGGQIEELAEKKKLHFVLSQTMSTCMRRRFCDCMKIPIYALTYRSQLFLSYDTVLLYTTTQVWRCH